MFFTFYSPYRSNSQWNMIYTKHINIGAATWTTFIDQKRKWCIIYEAGGVVEITILFQGKPSAAIKIGTNGMIFNLYGSSSELLFRRRERYLFEHVHWAGKGFFFNIKIRRKNSMPVDVFNFLKYKPPFIFRLLFCTFIIIFFRKFFAFVSGYTVCSRATKLRCPRARQTHCPLSSTSLTVCKSG